MAAALLLALAQGGLAQPPNEPPKPAQPTPKSLDVYEGRPIREVRLVKVDPDNAAKTVPVDKALEQLARNQIRSVAGTAFSAASATEDLTRLNRLGHFKTVRSDVQRLDDGSVILSFTFAEQPLIQDVQVIGNRELSDQDILKNIELLAGTPIDRFQIDRNARAIQDLYKLKGYYHCRATVDEKELAESQIVVYRIVEGDRLRVASVRFEGNQAFSPRELRSATHTTEYFPIFESGPLDDDVLDADKAALMKYYRDRGYLDAITSARVQPSPDGKEAIVTFEIKEGPLYTLRSVRILYGDPPGAAPQLGGTDTDKALARYREEILKNPAADVSYLTPDQMRQVGRNPLSDDQVQGLMTIKPGDVYSDNKLRSSIDAIRSAQGKLGLYLMEGGRPQSCTLRTTEVRDESKPLVDLILFIKAGTPTRTGEITVTGNEITRQQVILRELDIKSQRPLDAESLELSRHRLEQKRLWEPNSVKLSVQPEDPARPGERDVNVEVAETNTGKFTFGVAVGSDAGVVGTFGMQQDNFDVLDPPESFGEFISGRAFRGAGQKFAIDILPGSETQNYSVSLAEPALFESDFGSNGAVFYSTRDYRQYDEERYGGAVGLSRRFGTVWTGSAQLRVQSIDISNIDPTQANDVFDAQGRHALTGIGVQFVRNTTDNRFRPTRGNRITIGAEQVGVAGGDFDFTKMKAEYAGFFNVHESFLGYRTMLNLNSSIEYIPQGQDAVPVFERLYQGGQKFRGFGYRAIAPVGIRHDTGEVGGDPVGGTFSFFLGAEINQPLYKDIVSGVVFIDTGTVNEEMSLDNYRVSVGLGVRLYIQNLSPVPLAFDFGFPLMREDTDRRRLFSFSIDLPY